MGTINYRTGDIITFGTKNNGNSYYTERIHNLSKEIIDKYTFEWFKVVAEYGYYEGTSVIVDKDYVTEREIKKDNWPSWFKLDSDDITEIKSEIDDLCKLLEELARLMPITFPGWCMGYENTKRGKAKEIKNAIAEVIKELDKEVA